MDFSNLNTEFENWQVPAIESLFGANSELRTFEKDIRRRYGMFEKMKNLIENKEGMDRFTKGYEDYGVVVSPDGGIRCQEWAPNARALYLQGDFIYEKPALKNRISERNRDNFERLPYQPREFGKWELTIPSKQNGSCPIRHLSELKLIIETKDNQTLERISPWARYVVQRSPAAGFQWLFWNPHNQPSIRMEKRSVSLPRCDRLRIYEAHVGIASNRCEISSYQNFTRNVLPRIRDMGYNCVLLMAIMEHPYYPSLGYQVTNFFSASSRFGTPEDLAELIQTAHNMGLMVMMDVMHNQAPTNMREGLNMFDGSDGCYFYDERRGYCKNSNERNFDFTKWEVLRFLMSNLRYYLEEFTFDGFRFNGVTSMLYQDRAMNRHMNDKNSDYFGSHMDYQSMVYFMLANDMIHRYNPNAITIAEEYSEFPTLCRPIYEGGMGFDYRSTPKISDLWQKILKEKRDEEWEMDYLFRKLTNRRKGEKYIAYTENHEQSLAGKMTISRYLMNRDDMYETSPRSLALDRGLSLHKMIRLITHALAGESYMNFMGNEFGHPDWVEFPSPSNNNDMHRARRLFQLADDDNLRYKYLSRFDAAMNKAEEKYGWLRAGPAFVSRKHDGDKVFVFERAGLLFLFNFHPTQSYSDYRVGVEHAGRYEVVLDTDSKHFGGQSRTQSCAEFNTLSAGFDNRPKSLMVYLPSRCAIVMANRDFLSRSGYGESITNRGVCQQYYGSPYGQQTNAPARYTDASRSSSRDGDRNVVEENHHQRVSYRNRESSCDRYKHDHGSPEHGGRFSQSSSKSQGCDYRKEEYASSKHETAEYKEQGRYW